MSGQEMLWKRIRDAAMDPFVLLGHFADDRHWHELPGVTKCEETGLIRVNDHDSISATMAVLIGKPRAEP